MGPFMVEIVFCRVTRRGRKLKKGMNKAGLANTRNDGPSTTFIPPDDTVKITLDLSENGPVFNALDEMMMKMLDDESSDRKKTKKSAGGAGAKKALKSLLKSGIPGIEKMFAPAGKGKKGSAKGFHKMNDGSKKKFMKAIFGEDGTAIETGTAAALLAATCSGGDPEIGDKIAQLLVPELGDKIDPTMMAALMVACSMISAGAGMEEVLKAMKSELLDSGMPEEEIFRKTQLLMQAFGRDESGSIAEYSLVGKQKNSALKKIEISPKDFAQIVFLQRTIAACGATPENVAKVIMIENQLSKRGAQNRHIADALKKLMDPNKGKKDAIENLSKAITDIKMKKEDVQASVRVMQALEMENEPTWKEVKNMKDILQGASPNSPEAIELNLARATKAAGINRGEFTKILVAQKAMSVLGIDPKHLAQVMNIEKVIADNGVPGVEIARVLSDGGVPPDAHKKLTEITAAGLQKDFAAADVDSFVSLYDNLKLKANVPEETIEHIDKTLIQVRCSLEDVADNLIGSMSARGEKEHVIIRNLCETLKDTGASVQIVGTTMMGSLGKALPKTDPELMKDTGRSLTEVGYSTEDVNSTMTEILLNVLDEKPEFREEAIHACEIVMKDSGQFPDQIRKHLDAVVPPEEKKMDPRLAEELERLRAEDEARQEDRGDSDSECEFDESGRPIPKIIEPKNMAKAMRDRTGSGASSRRGSSVGTSPRGSISIGGTERRGSFYSEDVSKRNSIAIVVDDPENQKNMEKALNEVFDQESKDGGSLRDVLLEERAKLSTLKGKELEAQLAIIEALESSLASKEGSDDGTRGNQLSDIQESLLKSEMEKIAELTGEEKEAQMAKVESLKQSLSSSCPEDTHSINEGPSWKDRLSSLASIDPSELSIENSLDLVDKELEKISHLPESKKAFAMKELQELKKGLLTDIIKDSDSDQNKDTILRLLENKQGGSYKGDPTLIVVNIPPICKLRLQALMIRNETLCRFNIESVTPLEILELLITTTTRPYHSEKEIQMISTTVESIKTDLLLYCTESFESNAEYMKSLLSIDSKDIPLLKKVMEKTGKQDSKSVELNKLLDQVVNNDSSEAFVKKQSLSSTKISEQKKEMIQSALSSGEISEQQREMIQSALSSGEISEQQKEMIQSSLSSAAISEQQREMIQSSLSSATISEQQREMIQSSLSSAAISEQQRETIQSSLSSAAISEQQKEMIQSALSSAAISEQQREMIQSSLSSAKISEKQTERLQSEILALVKNSSQGSSISESDQIQSIVQKIAETTSGDSRLDSMQATQILSLVSQAVASDVSTSSKPETQNLKAIEKLLASQNVTGMNSKVSHEQLSKVLKAISGQEIKSLPTSRQQQYQEQKPAVTDGSSLTIGTGQTTSRTEEILLKDILSLQASGKNPSAQLELLQQLTSSSTLSKDFPTRKLEQFLPPQELANISSKIDLSSLKKGSEEEAREIVKTLLSQRGNEGLSSQSEAVLHMAKILSNEAAQTDGAGSLLGQKERELEIATSMLSQIVSDGTTLNSKIVEALAPSGGSNLNETSKIINNLIIDQKSVASSQLATTTEALASLTGNHDSFISGQSVYSQNSPSKHISDSSLTEIGKQSFENNRSSRRKDISGTTKSLEVNQIEEALGLICSSVKNDTPSQNLNVTQGSNFKGLRGGETAQNVEDMNPFLSSASLSFDNEKSLRDSSKLELNLNYKSQGKDNIKLIPNFTEGVVAKSSSNKLMRESRPYGAQSSRVQHSQGGLRDEPLTVTAYQDNERARRTLLFQDTPSRNRVQDHQTLSSDIEYTDLTDALKRENMRQYIQDAKHNIRSDRQLAEKSRYYQLDETDSIPSRRIKAPDSESEMNLYFQKRTIDPKLTSTSSRGFEPYSPRSDNESEYPFELNNSPTKPEAHSRIQIMPDERDYYRSQWGGSTHLFEDEIKDKGSLGMRGDLNKSSSQDIGASSVERKNLRAYITDSDLSHRTDVTESYDYEPLKPRSDDYEMCGRRSRYRDRSNESKAKAIDRDSLTQRVLEIKKNRSRCPIIENDKPTQKTLRGSKPLMDTNSILFNSMLRRAKSRGATDDAEHEDGLDLDLDAFLDLDPETVNEVVSAIEQSGLSEAEIQKLIGVFKLDGKIHHIGGVSKFRTSENIKNTILDTEDMFDRALDGVEAQKAALKKVGVSSETRELMKKILDKQSATEDASSRVSTILASTGLTSTRGVNYQKRDDVERVEYSSVKDVTVRRSKRRFDVPDVEIEETYRHPASLGIGVIGTGNQQLVRRNVKRRVSRFRALEESRESSVDEDRRITGLRRAKVPLMVYSCGGFTRCYRIARFHTVDGPPIGLKYSENPTSGL